MVQSKDKTIRDFGDQWNYLRENQGYYASVEMLRDILEPLMPIEQLTGKNVCEVGGGTGRVVRMLLDAGVKKVTVLEPSQAFDILLDNVSGYNDRVGCLQIKGDELNAKNEFDFICSIGVIHHIPEPEQTMKKIYQATKPNGQVFIWVYGREGNSLYLGFAEVVRRFTKLMPDKFLSILCHFLAIFLIFYIKVCKYLPLPMRSYMKNVVGRYKYYNIFLTIFDQLNPDYAKYYSQVEAEALLKNAGFVQVKSFNRHKYSWSVTGKKI